MSAAAASSGAGTRWSHKWVGPKRVAHERVAQAGIGLGAPHTKAVEYRRGVAGPMTDASQSPQTLHFVTGNPGKVRELQGLLGEPWRVEADDRGYPELQAETLAEVCRFGADHLLRDGLAPPFVLEDSGLFCAGLGGFPGVYSRHALDTIGAAGLLRLLSHRPEGDAHRAAWFETCLHYVDAAGAHHQFVGRCEGTIALAPAGQGGFGFDPVFVPRGWTRTFAQASADEKNAVSHRGQAVRAFARHLARK